MINEAKNSRLNEAIFKIIEKLEIDAKTHYEYIGILEVLNGDVKSDLREQINIKSELLESFHVGIEEERSKNQKLREVINKEKETTQVIREELEEVKAK